MREIIKKSEQWRPYYSPSIPFLFLVLSILTKFHCRSVRVRQPVNDPVEGHFGPRDPKSTEKSQDSESQGDQKGGPGGEEPGEEPAAQEGAGHDLEDGNEHHLRFGLLGFLRAELIHVFPHVFFGVVGSEGDVSSDFDSRRGLMAAGGNRGRGEKK